nr:hypothetical protein [Candidatus Gracilibacteria bacterium]
MNKKKFYTLSVLLAFFNIIFFFGNVNAFDGTFLSLSNSENTLIVYQSGGLTQQQDRDRLQDCDGTCDGVPDQDRTQDRDRLQDCDGTCDGVPDQDRTQDRDRLQDCDGTCDGVPDQDRTQD